MKFNRAAVFFISAAAVFGCGKIEPDPVLPPDEPVNPAPGPENPSWPEDQQGKTYIWDKRDIPEIMIKVPLSNWNSLLTNYDSNRDITQYVSCSFVFSKNNTADTVNTVGLRIRDNIDGMRPEGTRGESHSKKRQKWGLSNFELDFDLYKKENSLRNVKGMILRSCINDPTFARERFCHDLFRKFGIWTIQNNSYCRLSIYIEGDEAPAYLGIYQMIEPVDQAYLNDRRNLFKGSEGFIWRCSGGAFLKQGNINSGADIGKTQSRQYLLMNNQDKISSATAQLTDFITKLNTLKDSEFQDWIQSVTDMELLMKTYASISTVGMYDDYWNTGNNYFLYFNSFNPDKYKVYFIPYDFEKSLGNSETDSFPEPGTQNPYQWGKSTSVLLTRILRCGDFRELYTNALYELTLDDAFLFNNKENSLMIQDLMFEISRYTNNDTGQCMMPCDETAAWSTNKKYNLTKENDDNFFKVRSEAIINYIK